MRTNYIHYVRSGLAVIRADIYFRPDVEKQLSQLMATIAPTGDTSYLMRRDKFFRYCNQRDMWYGSQTPFLPYINLNDFYARNNNQTYYMGSYMQLHT